MLSEPNGRPAGRSLPHVKDRAARASALANAVSFNSPQAHSRSKGKPCLVLRHWAGFVFWWNGGRGVDSAGDPLDPVSRFRLASAWRIVASSGRWS